MEPGHEPGVAVLAALGEEDEIELGTVPIALARWSEGRPVWSRAGAITVPAGV